MSKPKTVRQLKNAYTKYLKDQPERIGFAQSRMDSIGGSDISTLFYPEDSYLTEYELYKSKTEIQSDDTDNDLLLIGDKIENSIIDIYKAKLSDEVSINYNPEKKALKDHPWLVGNPDGIATDGKKTWGIEVKNLGYADPDDFGNELEFIGGKIVEPAQKAYILNKFMLQMQFYMELYEFEFMDLIVLFKGSQFKAYRIYRNQELGSVIVGRATDWFFTHVIPRIPPAPVDSDSLQEYYSTVNNDIVNLDDAKFTQLEKYKKIKARIKELEEAAEGIKHEICEFMRGSTSAYYKGKEVCTWNQSDVKRLDSATIKEKYPEFFINNRITKKQRTFRVK